MPNVSWDTFIIRRSIDVGLFLQTHSIVTRERFLEKLSSLGVDPPGQEYLENLFPSPKPEEKLTTNTITATAKRKK